MSAVAGGEKFLKTKIFSLYNKNANEQQLRFVFFYIIRGEADRRTDGRPEKWSELAGPYTTQ